MNIRRFARRLALAAATIAFCNAAPAAAQLVNGGFETGDLSGWTAVDAPFAITEALMTHFNSSGPVDPQCGSWFAKMEGGNVDTYSVLSQTFSHADGDTLNISVRYACNEFGSTFVDDGDCTLTDGNGPNTFFAESCVTQPGPSDTGWQDFSFTLAGTSSTIECRVRNTLDSAVDPNLYVDCGELLGLPTGCDLTEIESKLDDEARFTDNIELNNAVTTITADIGMIESKLDDGARFTDNTELNNAVTTITGDVAQVESKLDDAARFTDDTELNSAVTTITDDIAFVESKLDAIGMDSLTDLESKLDDGARFTDDTELNSAVTTITGDVAQVESKLDDSARFTDDTELNSAVTTITGDIAFVESKLDDIGMDALTDFESKLDDGARFTDDTELNNAVTTITGDVAQVESKLDDSARFTDDTELNSAVTTITGDIAFVESKLDDIGMDALTDFESKLDDGARFTDDTELNDAVTTITDDVAQVESKLDDAARFTDDTELNSAVTTITDDIAFVESKLDEIGMDALVDLESKLDDGARFTDDTELNNAVTTVTDDVAQVESKLDDAARFTDDTELNNAVTTITDDVAQVESKLDDAARFTDDTELSNAVTTITDDVALVESKLDSGISDALTALESKLDDGARFTDDTELDDQTTTVVTEVDENQALLEDAKSEIMLLESKLDVLTSDVDELGCVIIDLLLTPEKERCTDTATCGFGTFPSGLADAVTPATCTSAPVAAVTHAPSAGKPGDVSGRAAASSPAERAAPRAAASVDLAAIESLVSEATDAARTARAQGRTFVATAIQAERIDPLLLLPAAQGGLFEQVVSLVSESLEMYHGFKLRREALYPAEDAFAEAERLRADGLRPAAYRAYRRAYLSLMGLSDQLE